MKFKMFLTDEEWLKKEGRTKFPDDYGLRRESEITEIVGWGVIIILAITLIIMIYYDK